MYLNNIFHGDYLDYTCTDFAAFSSQPNFAASLHILKVEIGGDAQSTDSQSFMDQRGFQKVKIVASDSKWSIVSDIKKDTKLAGAVDYIGVHYPGTNSPSDAKAVGKQLWSSEDYSTFNDNVGAGCWARILNQNYVNGLMTSTISWNLIASYYEALPYTRNGLMTADTPWSGFYRVESPIWMTAHTTQFVWPGWTYFAHDKGVYKLKKGGSMVSFLCPMKKDLTIIIETLSHDHSVCIRPPLPPYTVEKQDITIQLKGYFANLTSINVWYSKLGFGNDSSTLFKKMTPLKVTDGKVSLSVGVDEVYTLTTQDGGNKGVYPEPPADKAFPLPYKDNFEDYAEHAEPNNFAQQIGAFEVVQTNDVRKKVLLQKVLEYPCSWCEAEKAEKALNIIGNYQWREVHITVDFMIPPINGTTGVFVAGRIDKGGCVSWEAKGIFLYIFPKTKSCILANDLARTQVIYQGQVSNVTMGWNTVDLLLKKDYAVGVVNGEFLFNVSVPSQPANGFVGLGTDSFGLANFDNFAINPSSQGETMLNSLSRVNTLSSRNKNRSSDTLYFKPGL
ncbi:hypothetical protein FSP39_015418 [Pinctada imbricata]|uniref:Glycosyl hydrolase family 59 central domain-containing protein n=1 Tax=Pinctada imbricata TaxID=66713 RepID=A0AA88Y0B4_PINIB|nr:hypothetical protein FSP39_015418 [Pinctada imbricata]